MKGANGSVYVLNIMFLTEKIPEQKEEHGKKIVLRGRRERKTKEMKIPFDCQVQQTREMKMKIVSVSVFSFFFSSFPIQRQCDNAACG